MHHFITGASGFIGQHLLEQLLRRPDATIHVLVRRASRERFRQTLARYGAMASRIHLVAGDITQPGLVDPAERDSLPRRIDHVFHLAAVYDMGMSDEEAARINCDGTREVIAFVNGLAPGVRFHHVSSVGVSGDHFDGEFREDSFDEGQPLDHPYYRSKFESERLVRELCRVPFRIYRPGIVVGHSRTGAIAKIDGPYYFFEAIRLLARFVPRFVPLFIVEGGRMPVVPVDYVARAIDAIAHRDDLDETVFCLLAPDPPSAGALVSELVRVAGGPKMVPLGFRPAARLAHGVIGFVSRCIPARVARLVSRLFGIPTSVFGQLFTQTTYDDRNARRALDGTGVECPPFHAIAATLWEGWEAHRERSLARPHDDA